MNLFSLVWIWVIAHLLLRWRSYIRYKSQDLSKLNYPILNILIGQRDKAVGQAGYKFKWISSLQEKKKHLCYIMKVIDLHFRRSGVDYFITDGTLLGAIRNHQLIPWDVDLDLGCLDEEALESLVCPDDLFKVRYENHIWRVVHKDSGYYADIFIYESDGETIVQRYGKSKMNRSKYNTIFPSVDYEFSGMKVLGPNNPEAFWKDQNLFGYWKNRFIPDHLYCPLFGIYIKDHIVLKGFLFLIGVSLHRIKYTET